MVNELLIAHAPVAPERLHARVYELVPVPRSRTRRLTYFALPAAAALAVAAAVVHGVVGSGGSPTPVAAQHRAAFAPNTDTLGVASGGGTGAVPLAPSVGAATDKAFVPGSLGRLQHTDVTLSVRVADVQGATTKAVRIAASLGGYAQNVQYDSSTKSSYLTIRVPTANARVAASRLSALGTIVSQQLSVQDLEQELRTQTAQIAQLRRTVVAYEKALADPALPAAQRVILQIRLANAKRTLSERVHARGGTIAAGASSTVTLTLVHNAASVLPPHHRGRLGRMLHSALGFLALEGTIVLYALIAVGPFVLLGIGALMLGRVRRRRLVGDLME